MWPSRQINWARSFLRPLTSRLTEPMTYTWKGYYNCFFLFYIFDFTKILLQICNWCWCSYKMKIRALKLDDFKHLSRVDTLFSRVNSLLKINMPSFLIIFDSAKIFRNAINNAVHVIFNKLIFQYFLFSIKIVSSIKRKWIMINKKV
jgi:hypothetical protein